MSDLAAPGIGTGTISVKSVNDMLNYASKGLIGIHVSADAAGATPAGVRVMKIVVSPAGGAGTALIYNAASVVGTAVLTIYCAASQSQVVDFSPHGLVFDVGLSIDLTAAIVEVFYVTD